MDSLKNKIQLAIKYISEHKKHMMISSVLVFLMLLITSNTVFAADVNAGEIIKNVGSSVVVNYVIVPIGAFILDLMVWVLDTLTGLSAILLQTTNLNDVSMITETWKVVRDGVNIVFIAVLLVVGIFNIINYEPETYALSEYMPLFAIAVIGVNFSKLICFFILDFCNVLTATIFNFVGGAKSATGLGIYGENIGNIVKGLTKYKEYSNNKWLIDGNFHENIVAAISLAIGIILTGLLIYGFAGLCASYFVRLIKLWVLIASSPLFFLGLSSQYLRNISDGWWESFWKYASMPIKVSAYLSIGMLLANKLMNGTSGLSGLSAGVASDSFFDIKYILGLVTIVGTLYAAFDMAEDGGVGDKFSEAIKKPVGAVLSKPPIWLAKTTAMHIPILPGTGFLKPFHHLDKGLKKLSGGRLKNIPILSALGALGERGPMMMNARRWQHVGKSIYQAVESDTESKAQDIGGRQAEAITKAWSTLPGQRLMFDADTVHLKYREQNISGTKSRASEIEKGLEGYNKTQLLDYIKNAKRDDQKLAGIQQLASKGWLQSSWEDIGNIFEGEKFTSSYEKDGKTYEKNEKVDAKNVDSVKKYVSSILGEDNYASELHRKSVSAHKSNVQNYREEAPDKYDGIDGEFIRMLENHDNGVYVDPAMFEGYLRACIEDGKSTTTALMKYMTEARENDLLSYNRFTSVANQAIQHNMAFEFMRQFDKDLVDPDGEDALLADGDLVINNGKHNVTLKTQREFLDFVAKLDMTDAVDAQTMDQIRANYVMESSAVSERMNNQLNIETVDKDFWAEFVSAVNEDRLKHFLDKVNGRKQMTDTKLANAYAGLMNDIAEAAATGNTEGFIEKTTKARTFMKKNLIEAFDIKYDETSNTWKDIKGDIIHDLDNLGDAEEIVDNKESLQKFMSVIQDGINHGKIKERKDIQGATLGFLANQKVVVSGKNYNALDFMSRLSDIIQAKATNNATGISKANEVFANKTDVSYKNRINKHRLRNTSELTQAQILQRLKNYDDDIEGVNYQNAYQGE